jgi:GT2 family glycosyltransferase
METLAPPVVAVVVAHDPGPWFEETLASLGSQDYAELSVLVLDNAGADDLTTRVAAVLPTAFVRRFEEGRGYGAVSDEVRTMVDGAAYYLFCHDDVAPFPDAVHQLVEEAYRSNAGIVSPKVVGWDDPDRLVHVGMTVDKSGSVVERVQPHEIDHGQHDAVRDVFVAPGGCTLVRVDLFDELGGFDPDIVAMGEDLDLCWRAQVVGARVVVAPAARVRHLEELAGGTRPLDPVLLAGPGGPARHPVTLQALQRRHELLAVLKCYGRFHRLRVVPQIVLLNLGEYLVAQLAGNRARARAVAHAWRWNLHRRGTTRRLRRELQAHRRIGDKEVRELQISGSARLASYLRRVFLFGFHGAHAEELRSAEEAAAQAAAEAGAAAVVGGPGVTVAGGAPPATTGPPEAPAPAGAAGDAATGDEAPVTVERGRLSGRVRLTAWLVAAAVVLIGSRQLLTGSITSFGQFVPFPSWGATFTQFAAGWHPSGVGTTAPATPALAVAGVVGTVLLGAMGLTQKVLLLACIPLGAWGMVRLARPFGSARASLVAGIVYLAIPLPYDALALGRLGALAAYAGAPWVLGHLFRATGFAPYSSTTADAGDGVVAAASGSGPRSLGRRLAGHRTLRACLLLGALEALLVAFVPAAALVVVVAGAAVAVASVVLGRGRAAVQALWLALGSTVVAGVLLLPWLIGVLSAGRGAVEVFGVPTPTSGAASWGTLLRFSIGPIGGSPLGWAFALAALLPLLLARGPRFRWAGRCWSIALVFWFLAWVVGRGWTGSLAVDPMVLLAPAAAAIAMAVGLGIAAFEVDLRAAAFGWRQLATAVAVGALALGTLPTLVSAVPGRWQMPQNAFAQTLAWMHGETSAGAFRVLWLGDPRSLNQGSWAAGDGLAYATSEDGMPDATWLWNGTSPGPAAALGSAVSQARDGATDRLGALLAPAGVRYVVELTAPAPVIPQVQTPASYPVPADLPPALQRQLDLQSVFTEGGVTVYENTDWLPERSAVGPGSAPAAAAAALPVGTPASLPATTTRPGQPVIPGAVPVLPGPPARRSYQGPVPGGVVLAAVSPAGRWTLVSSTGTVEPATSSFGWAAQYRVPAATSATLRFRGGPWAPLGLVVEVLLWLAAAAALVERRHRVRPWAASVSGGWRHRRAEADPIPGMSDEPTGDLQDGGLA